MRLIRRRPNGSNAAKGRPSDNPLIVHICRFEELLSIAKEVPPQAEKLADAFLAGAAYHDRMEE